MKLPKSMLLQLKGNTDGYDVRAVMLCQQRYTDLGAFSWAQVTYLNPSEVMLISKQNILYIQLKKLIQNFIGKMKNSCIKIL